MSRTELDTLPAPADDAIALRSADRQEAWELADALRGATGGARITFVKGPPRDGAPAPSYGVTIHTEVLRRFLDSLLSERIPR